MKKSAFTLLEMIVVMVIIMMVSAASLPSFLKFANTSRLRASARDITTALRTTRRLAITTRIARSVRLYLNDYAIESMRNAISFYETNTSIKLQRAAANVYFIDVPDNSPTSLRFRFSARGTTGSDTIRVVDPNNRYIDITVVGATGRVRIGDIQE